MRRVAVPTGWRTVVSAVLAAVVVACSQGSAAAAVPHASALAAVGSAEQVDITGLSGGEQLTLVDRAGATVQRKAADSLGGLVFYGVAPGGGYRVRAAGGAQSAPLTVHSDASAPWDPSVYDQPIADTGYQYLSTRDGTKLAIDVHLPAGASATAPYPTLIEYAGYGYADPSGPESGIATLANLMGFAVVDVNMRGSGCSGGAYNYFEALQNLDGYDVIETIAHQPWVLDHKVGMMGISYGAISQLFTAQTDPPDLEAISPLSTIDATATTLYPGGVLNTGFALSWALQRQQQAQPGGIGLSGTESYVDSQINAGDSVCEANQVLHGEAQNLRATIRANAHYIPASADPLDPTSFVSKIHVPVFMACQFEDEQTGAHCPDLVAHMTGTKEKWFTFTNGAHIDSLDPATYDRWYDFLSLFVAHRAPAANAAAVQASAPLVYQQAMGVPSTDQVTLPADPIQAIPTYAAALAAFRALPEVRVLFDNGAGDSPAGIFTPGNPYPGFERTFSTLPVPGTVARTWYLAPSGTLAARPARSDTVNWYRSEPRATGLTDYSGTNTSSGGLWGDAAQWSWNWRQNPRGTAVSYLSAPLTQNTTVIGAGAVHVWVRSSTPDVDLQATVSEVDPDGDETFVQNGWLRADERTLSTSTANELKQPSTLLAPTLSLGARDVTAMPKGRFVELVIPLYYEGHVYRTGSRIRLTISAPNGTQPVWSFAQTAGNGARVSVEASPRLRSGLILPVVRGVSVPTPIPPCHSLRNEPCRTYAPSVNQSASPRA
jgi:predicted acyl esterase